MRNFLSRALTVATLVVAICAPFALPAGADTNGCTLYPLNQVTPTPLSPCTPVGACTTAPTCPGGTGCLLSKVYYDEYIGERPTDGLTNPPVRLNVPQFNPAEGNLLRVEYCARLQLTQLNVTIRNDNTNTTCNVTSYARSYTQQITDPAGNGMIPGTATLQTIQNTFPAIQLVPGATAAAPIAPNFNTPLNTDFFCVAAPSPAFTGTGCAQFVPNFIFSPQITVGTPCANVTAIFQIAVKIEVFVKYWYCRNPPQALPDLADTCAGQTKIINVLANDLDGNGLPLTSSTVNCGSLAVVAGQGPTKGVVTVVPCPAGSVPCIGSCFQYVPNAGQPPSNVPVIDTFKYTFLDSFGCLSTQGCVNVIIHPKPTLTADTIDICQGDAITFDVLSNDVGGLALGTSFTGTCQTPSTINVPAATFDCNSLTINSSINTTTQGTLLQNQNCATVSGAHPCASKCLKFTPVSTFIGTVTFTYSVNDNFGCSPSTATVTINVRRKPTANNDSFTLCQGRTLDIDVLANDSASAGTLQCQTITIVSPPAHGTATKTAGCNVPVDCPNCRVRYVADPNFTGTDSFTYTVQSLINIGGTNTILCTSNAATVSITIKPRPVVNDDKYLVNETSPDLPPITFNVLENDTLGGFSYPGSLPANLVLSVVPGSGPTQGTIVSFNATTGAVVYDPNPNFVGEDIFNYRICDASTVNPCCDEAVVRINRTNPCVEVNRRTPGSLLIWPEFDNRVSRITLCTVTNTNCDHTPTQNGLEAGTVDFHYLYVGKYGPNHVELPCLKTDRTIRLTPCDTFTWYTTADNPAYEQGYIYGYATSPITGKAITFNHLIGDEILFSAFEDNEDSVNAIVFRAVPQPQGTPTDLDNDGVRDLDGMEYDPAPDEILIPRFLGQDPDGPNAVFRSRLFLIGLTGTQFTTQIGFSVFNDNEVPSSVNFEFKCWDDPYLTDIGGNFLNQFLKSQGDDPNEILGAPTREAGWMRLDGVIAYTNLKVVDDPAFYAVLFERTTPRPVIALPFELCSQNNGDLLPQGPLGDQ